MTFISIKFYCFLLITVFVYFILPLKVRYLALLAASICFYSFAGWQALALMAVSALVAYLMALWMDHIYEKPMGPEGRTPRSEKENKQELRKIQYKRKGKCRVVLIMAVIILLGVLAVTKASRYLPAKFASKIIIPLGISYYTFSIVGYLADVYWKKQKAEKNFLSFLLFVMYFPKVLQGPISRYKNLGPQLAQGHRFDYERVCFGLQLALWGVFKKLVIGDRLAILVNQVYGNWESYSGSVILVATLLASVQLYCDFSGYMDMASGMSEIFGIELEQNFNHPFFSKNAAEFWRRWHITLGTWFKDYVYMPLVISPKLMKIAQKFRKWWGLRASKTVMTVIPLAVVWLLTGIWHGTGWNYVVWGIYWGGMIILSSSLEPEIKKLARTLKINTETVGWQIFQMVRTYILFSIGRLITMPGNLRASLAIARKIIRQFDVWNLCDGTLFNLGLDRPNFMVAMLAIALLWLVGFWQEKGKVRQQIAESNILFRWIIYYAAIAIVIVFGVYGPGFDASAFAYMNF